MTLHDAVDRSFSNLDLRSADGYSRFLIAHHAAMTLCQPALTRFARQELGQEAPDLALMLKTDLARVGIVDHRDCETSMLPACEHKNGAGIAYVVLGSRVGIAMLGKQYRAPPNESPWVLNSLYFRDRQGLALWRRYIEWCDRTSLDRSWREQAIAEAVSAFRLFQCASARGGAIRAPSAAPDSRKKQCDS